MTASTGAMITTVGTARMAETQTGSLSWTARRKELAPV